MALTVDRSSACASCERGNCSFSNGCSCACSILNIKDFHKFVNFRPALDSALVCGFHAYEVVAEHAVVLPPCSDVDIISYFKYMLVR